MDINTYEFDELTLISKEHIMDYFDNYRFFQDLEYIENAESILLRLSKEFDIIICSLGREMNLSLKRRWLFEHMPYADFIGIDVDTHSDKSCVDMSWAYCFVDDCSSNLFTSNCPRNILYGDTFSWNSDWQGLHLYNWTDFEKWIVRNNL
jgi:5'(3')-deoxyribonucleotidase